MPREATGATLAALHKFAASALMLTLVGCATKQPTYPPHPRPVTRPAEPAPSAATFVATNGSIDLFVIRSSELALQRSTSPRVRDFASRMIAAHKGTSAQLSLAGRRLNLLPSASLRPTDQAMLDALEASGSFDAEYIRDQRTVHQQAIALDSAFASNGESPTLRPVAAAALSIEQRHLKLLAYL
jgi:putative membrane protein